MNDKKIYCLLQQWFPELDHKKVPKADKRRDFAHFKAWMMTEKSKKHLRSFMTPFDSSQISKCQLETSAFFQDEFPDLSAVQSDINQAIQPMLEHYELNRGSIGKHYDVQEQAADMIFGKISAFLSQKNHRMLLIDADVYYWIAVPEQAEKVNKFCRKFETQFKAENIKIELFTAGDCLRST